MPASLLADLLSLTSICRDPSAY